MSTVQAATKALWARYVVGCFAFVSMLFALCCFAGYLATSMNVYLLTGGLLAADAAVLWYARMRIVPLPLPKTSDDSVPAGLGHAAADQPTAAQQ